MGVNDTGKMDEVSELRAKQELSGDRTLENFIGRIICGRSCCFAKFKIIEKELIEESRFNRLY